MSLETRSNSALMKRSEQLKRWQESETYKEPSEPKLKKSRRIGFSDGCVFLAACAAGDKGEVEALLARGADIDTANVDGLTALHQACIDDNLEMVEFLVEHKADVNRGDNEGWTPLHATASCGFLSIARYLLDFKANVAAVNNDGELAIDISESDEMEELLQKEITLQKIDCEEARHREEREMLNDARQWVNSGVYGDVPHIKTGATALHVAAAKGYIKVISLLLQAGSQVNIQDNDGWTPLHAAAHWAQREACELLVESSANMEIKNCVGQTPFDVADPDVLRLLEDLKKKQATLQKDKPLIDVIKIVPSSQPPPPKRSINNNNNGDYGEVTVNSGTTNNTNVLDRSSITRLSYDDKLLRSKEATVKETIAEEKVSSDRKDDFKITDSAKSRYFDGPGLVVTDESGKEAVPGFIPPHPDTGSNKDDSASWRRPGSLRARPTASPSGKLSPGVDEGVVRRAHSFGSDDKFYAKLAELRQRIRANSLPVLHQENPNLTHSIYIQTNSLPRPAKSHLPSLIESSEGDKPPEGEKPPLPPKPSPPHSFTSMIAGKHFRSSEPNLPSKLTELTTLHENIENIGRRVADDTISKQSPDLSFRGKIDKNLSGTVRRLSSDSSMLSPSESLTSPSSSSMTSISSSPGVLSPPGTEGSITNMFKTFFKSFVPPVRDEEHEIQRKAHAKRVRETRRSTQGVTLEDLKSAEQLVKKKQQQENQQRTTELQQLVTSEQSLVEPPGSTATTTVTTSTALTITDTEKIAERRPSWRLRMDAGEKSRFTLEDSRASGGETRTTSSAYSRQDRLSTQSPERRISRPFSSTYTSTLQPPPDSDGGSPGTPTLQAKARKKKPKRRSTGVVNIDMDEFDKSEESGDENIPSSSSQTTTDKSSKSVNGDIDYKKLWEESQAENTRLRMEMSSIRQDLDSSKHQLETAIQASTKNAVSDAEKREKKMLEKKLGEMEEELKLLALSENLTDQTLDQLKADNQRLRDENGALIRVISKLSK